MSQVSPDSYGVGNWIVSTFMEAFSKNPSEASMFYDANGVLFYQGNLFQGRDKIREFLESRGATSITVTGWEVQTVPEIPDAPKWTMVVAFGSIEEHATGAFASFHAAFYVRHESGAGFITYNAFNCF